MHAAGALACGSKVRLDADVQFRRQSALAHLIDMHIDAAVAVAARWACVHYARQREVGGLEVRNAEGDRPKAADLILGGDRAFVPRVGRAFSAVVHEAEPLALRIFEIEELSPVAFRDRIVRHTERGETLLPPGEALPPRDAQARAHDTVGAAPLTSDRPVEKGEVGARRGETVRVEQVIGADVILVDRLLDEPHAERGRVEGVIAGGIGGQGGEVVDAGQVHVATRRH
jgi:hypothetical protein